MKQEFNNEFLAACFAAYWGCGVYHPCDAAPFYYRGTKHCPDDIKQQNRPVLYGDWSGGTNPNLSCEGHCDWDVIKLILKPLSAISDEDAVEVANIFGNRISEDVEREDCFDFIGFQYYLVELFEVGSDMMDITLDKAIKAIDFLRKQGYMIPFRGVDLFKAGIAIDATTI